MKYPEYADTLTRAFFDLMLRPKKMYWNCTRIYQEWMDLFITEKGLTRSEPEIGVYLYRGKVGGVSVPEKGWGVSVPEKVWTVSVPEKGWTVSVPEKVWTVSVPEKVWTVSVPEKGWAEDVLNHKVLRPLLYSISSSSPGIPDYPLASDILNKIITIRFCQDKKIIPHWWRKWVVSLDSSWMNNRHTNFLQIFRQGHRIHEGYVIKCTTYTVQRT